LNAAGASATSVPAASCELDRDELHAVVTQTINKARTSMDGDIARSRAPRQRIVTVLGANTLSLA
jgi:hypothetical protein